MEQKALKVYVLFAISNICLDLGSNVIKKKNLKRRWFTLRQFPLFPFRRCKLHLSAISLPIKLTKKDASIVGKKLDSWALNVSVV
jgi:hypothetical protein